MTVPEHLWRFSTAQAIASLAVRLKIPFEPWMQDWEWVVADSSRIDEYIDVYQNAGLTDDERFTLMETIIQAFENRGGALQCDKRWIDVLYILDQNIDLHAHSVWYWADLENEVDECTWRVTPYFRAIIDRHTRRLDP